MKRWLAGAGALTALVFGTVVFGPHSAPPLPALALGGSGQVCRPSGPPVAGNGVSVAQAAYAAGFRGADLVIAVAVARAESGWQATALNDANTDGSTDYGLFQINSIHAAILAGGDWRDPDDNAVMAHQVWLDAGSSWSPWVTYWSGTYRQSMALAAAAVAGLGDCTARDPGAGPQGADGLTPRAEAIKATTIQRWGCARKAEPCVPYVGGYARRNISGTDTPSDHSTGKAVDIMLPADYRSAAANSLGWEIARFWQTGAGVKYIIFDAKIWNPAISNEWRPYQHPGGVYSDVLQHLNHVHISVV